MSTPSRGRELSRDQHRRIRQQIALIPLYIWVVYAWWAFISHLPVPPINATTHVTRDFLHFYTQAVIAREHDLHALYDIDAMAAVAQRVVPAHVEVKFPPVYGPQVPLLFLPLAWLPYVPAMITWLALTIVGYGLCMWAVWRNGSRERGFGWPALVLWLGAPGLPVFAVVRTGVADCAGVLHRNLAAPEERTDSFLAGLAVGASRLQAAAGDCWPHACSSVPRSGRWWPAPSCSIAAQAAAGWGYWGRACSRDMSGR